MVTRDQAQSAIQGNVQDEDASKDAVIVEGEKERVEVDGRRRFFRLREIWSWAIISWISVLILFTLFLTYKVGSGCWSFADMEWFITAVTVETFLQIVGLGYVAAKYLFSDG